MAPENGDKKFSILKPRFKGIETFLKKIAFNLGNTPSQTEVKIISCIPIDVTDLQNKIVDLERELDERDNARDNASVSGEDRGRPRPKVQAAIGAPVYTPSPLFADPPINTPESPPLHPEPPSPSSLGEVNSIRPVTPKSSIEIVPVDRPESNKPNWSNDEDLRKRQKRIAPRRKKIDKRKGKAQLVYFAQNVYPKNVNEKLARREKRRMPEMPREDDFRQNELVDVVKRQYRPEPVAVEPSSSSGFSWPVCRDEPPGNKPRPPCDSDVCSCCHGLFHNVDIPNEPNTSQNANLKCHDYSVYYDSSLYDIVPVKERPSRIVKNSDIYQKLHNDAFYNIEPDYLLTKSNKPRVQFQQPYIANYCSVSPPCSPVPKLRHKKKLPNKSALKREQVIRAMQKRKRDYEVTAEESFSCCVDCSEVYMKPLYPRQRSTIPPPPTPPPPSPCPPRLLKNAECLTTNLNDTECQTSTSRSVQLEPIPPEENKTEATLNQIKAILHAVLTEVKTSAQNKHNAVEDKCTKDAIVQNGLSQSNMGSNQTNSSFMNSYLYSPRYSFCPYGPSFSGQTAGSQGFYQGMTLQGQLSIPGQEVGMTGPPGPSPCAGAAKCLQNYPLFIHTTGRQCTCCYRSVPTKPNIPGQNTQPGPAPGQVTATNETNRNETRTKETNNLIREIYKSLAVNYGQRNNSSANSEYKYSAQQSKKLELKYEPKAKPKVVVSEVIQKTETRPLVFTRKALENQYGSTAASYRTEVTTASGSGSSAPASRGDGVLNLLSAKKELVSTPSDSPHETRHSHRPPTGRDREYSSPQKREREYSSPHKRERGYSPPDKRDREHTPDKRDRRYPRGYSPRKEIDKYNLQDTSVSDDDTITPSDDSEPSEATIIGTDKTEKKKQGLFSKMKKLFTTRPRRRRKISDSSSDDGQGPTSDSDEYETVYSESIRSEKHAKYRPPTPPPMHRRRRQPHSKASLRYNGRRPATPRSPRRRRDAPAPALRARCSPYMEQEYRRHWTEDLMFHRKDAPRFSSERPFTQSGPRYERRRPPAPYPYWREYEARRVAPPPAFPPASPHVPPSPYNRPPSPPEKVSNCGQTTPLPLIPKPTYLPRSYKPAPRGLAWFKSLNKPGCLQCGVQWKRFFLDG